MRAWMDAGTTLQTGKGGNRGALEDANTTTEAPVRKIATKVSRRFCEASKDVAVLRKRSFPCTVIAVCFCRTSATFHKGQIIRHVSLCSQHTVGCYINKVRVSFPTLRGVRRGLLRPSYFPPVHRSPEAHLSYPSGQAIPICSLFQLNHIVLVFNED